MDLGSLPERFKSGGSQNLQIKSGVHGCILELVDIQFQQFLVEEYHEYNILSMPHETLMDRRYNRCMIHTLSGKLTEWGEGYIVVETGGIGFKVFTNARTASRAPAGGEVKLFSHLYVREDKLELYGFLEEGALKLFELLISVSGIGPKSALAILDIDATENIIAAIAGKRPDILTRASGVGLKTAERVILELQSRIKMPSGTKRMTEAMDVNQEVEEALVGLGYSRLAVREIMSKVAPEFKTLEDRLRQALKILGRR